MNDSDSTALPLGRVVATERKPNTPHEFHFWTALDSPVGIGHDRSRRRRASRRTGGSRTSTASSSRDSAIPDLLTPLHDVLGHDGITVRRVARHDQARRDSTLHGGGAAAAARGAAPAGADGEGRISPSENDVAVALRMDGYLEGGITHRNSDRRVSAPAARKRRFTSMLIFSSDPRPRT